MKNQTFHTPVEQSAATALQTKLLCSLRCLLRRKPPDSASSSALEEFNLKLQELYFELIAGFPKFAIGQKLELEMWNNLYKTHIDSLQNALHNRTPGATTTILDGQQRSIMELKLRFVLLLDRASGVYLSLINRLVHSLSDTSWPKSVLGSAISPAAPLGLFKFNRIGMTSGRFDLDLATFSALPGWFNHALGHSYKFCSALGTQSTADTATPRILSRGDRLPTEQIGSDTKSVADISVSNGKVNLCNIVSDFSTSEIDDEVAMSYMIQHCLVHLGDVARYRQQPNVAAGYYLWAWIVHPDSGHPYNQLAIVESSKGVRKRLDASLYYYIRAVACQYPFPAARTNMKALLRGQLITGAFNVERSSWTANDIQELLLRFYASLQLCTDSSKLIALASAFAAAATQCDRVLAESDWLWLTRLIAVHLYFLTEHLKDTDLEQSMEGERNQCDIGRTVLLYVTVYWFELITRQCPYPGSSQCDVREHSGLLVPLVLLLLWLRLQSSSSGSASLDAGFRIYAPPLSDAVVNFLNNLIPMTGSAGNSVKTCSTAFSPRQPVDATPDWPKLLHLPELAQLQGFQPLGVPTHRALNSTESANFLCPFPVGSPFRKLFSLYPCINEESRLSADDESSSRLDDLESRFFAPPGSVVSQRVQFILESARIVTRQLPALIGWCDSAKETSSLETTVLGGRFRHVSRPVVVLSELILTPHRSSEQTLGYSSNSSDMLGSVHKGPLISESPVLSASAFPTKESSENVLSTTSSAQTQSGSCHVPTTNLENHIENGLPSSAVVKHDHFHAPVPSTSGESFVTVSNLSTASVPASSSGGLIVNAELAKFIQEQASQVAARQQRAELSSGNLRELDEPVCNGTNSKSVFGESAGLKNNKPYSSRLCLSPSFLRDLPPRFARRLQAELLEREAAEQRLSLLKIADPSKCNGSELLSLDQPAPLARKESEAPLELDSLLSATDALNPVGTSEQPIDAHFMDIVSQSPSINSVGLGTGLLTNANCINSCSLVTQYQNSSLFVSSGPHISSSVPPYSIRNPLLPFSQGSVSLDRLSLKSSAVANPPEWREPECFAAQSASDYASRFMLPPYTVAVSANSVPALSPNVLNPLLTSPEHNPGSVDNNRYMLNLGTPATAFVDLPYSVQPPGGPNMAGCIPSYVPQSMVIEQQQIRASASGSSANIDGPFVYTSVP